MVAEFPHRLAEVVHLLCEQPDHLATGVQPVGIRAERHVPMLAIDEEPALFQGEIQLRELREELGVGG
jgi:hypothetical protein